VIAKQQLRAICWVFSCW